MSNKYVMSLESDLTNEVTWLFAGCWLGRWCYWWHGEWHCEWCDMTVCRVLVGVMVLLVAWRMALWVMWHDCLQGAGWGDGATGGMANGIVSDVTWLFAGCWLGWWCYWWHGEWHCEWCDLTVCRVLVGVMVLLVAWRMALWVMWHDCLQGAGWGDGATGGMANGIGSDVTWLFAGCWLGWWCYWWHGEWHCEWCDLTVCRVLVGVMVLLVAWRMALWVMWHDCLQGAGWGDGATGGMANGIVSDVTWLFAGCWLGWWCYWWHGEWHCEWCDMTVCRVLVGVMVLLVAWRMALWVMWHDCLQGAGWGDGATGGMANGIVSDVTWLFAGCWLGWWCYWWHGEWHWECHDEGQHMGWTRRGSRW